MGIAEQIAMVEREFVPGNILLAALAQQEQVSEFQAARWFMRNIKELDSLQMIEFNRDLKDFQIVDIAWASDILGDGYNNTSTDLDWQSRPGYFGGWLSSELKQFFLKSSLNYPLHEIERLQNSSLIPTTDDSVRIARAAGGANASVHASEAESAVASRWPWGDHHTESLGHLEAAAKRYWVNYDPADTTTASTNTTVSDWLQTERKVSRTMADSIASMLRADGLPTGPRK